MNFISPIPVCLSACLPVCLCLCLSACLPVSLFVCLSVCFTLCLFHSLPVCLSAFHHCISSFERRTDYLSQALDQTNGLRWLYLTAIVALASAGLVIAATLGSSSLAVLCEARAFAGAASSMTLPLALSVSAPKPPLTPGLSMSFTHFSLLFHLDFCLGNPNSLHLGHRHMAQIFHLLVQ